MRRTKLVATVGPASRKPEVIREMIRAGTNVFRLNFSHGTWQDHTEAITIIRATSAELNMPVAVLQDLAGPKIRITSIEGDAVQIADGQKLELRLSQGEKSSAKCVYVEGVDPAAVLQAGHQVLMADGAVVLHEAGAIHEAG